MNTHEWRYFGYFFGEIKFFRKVNHRNCSFTQEIIEYPLIRLFCHLYPKKVAIILFAINPFGFRLLYKVSDIFKVECLIKFSWCSLILQADTHRKYDQKPNWIISLTITQEFLIAVRDKESLQKDFACLWSYFEKNHAKSTDPIELNPEI